VRFQYFDHHFHLPAGEFVNFGSKLNDADEFVASLGLPRCGWTAGSKAGWGESGMQ
jgi:hypothetical protein